MSKLKTDKLILDACCGGRMFWFDPYNEDVVFGDIRKEDYRLCDGRMFTVRPDIIMDFRNIPYEDNSFSLVVFDPPHLKYLAKNTWMAQKYGLLFETWQVDIKEGVNECMRVLKPGGTLVFKWNEAQIKLNQVLKCIEHKPLFGHVTGKHGRTIWMCFLKKITMNEERLREYRGLVGVQLQFEERGDTHKVMEMQLEMEKWVALQIQADIVLAWQGMKAHPMHEVNCSMTVAEIKAYRMLVAEAMKIYSEGGFVPWSQQQEKIELFVQGAIDKHVLDATRPSITIGQN